jgi:hypothetical protein
MTYIVNPKLAGSGMLAAIPQVGICPVGCADCFFQSGRSYLEPLEKNLPNMPSAEEAEGKVVRVNDGNDSNNQRDLVIDATNIYKQRFFNTSLPIKIGEFPAPVVLTINPSKMTDSHFHKISDPLPKNLMYVRFRVNMWNTALCDEAVTYYTSRKIPVILTFMAYYELTVPEQYKDSYEFRKRTLNSYWVLTQKACDSIIQRYVGNSLVYTCGKDAKTYACARCGNCLREYFACKERMAS